MALTTFNCPTCGPYSGSCCPTCAPATPIFQGECQDPGTQTRGSFLPVLDFKFCDGRLSNAPGLLVNNINGSGNASFGWTVTPQVQLTEYLATKDVAFGSLIVMGSDYRWRYLQGPPTLGLFAQTDANGNLFLGDPPTASVPDPLNINNLNVAVKTTTAALTTSSTVTLNNLAAGTVVDLLGLNASNEIVLQSLTTSGVAISMFYESNSSPGSGAPNENKTNSQYLIIGNNLFDSGAGLINVSTSESLIVAKAGKYVLLWMGQVQTSGAARPNAGVWLQINGVIVNWGNGRTTTPGGAANSPDIFPLSGMEARSLAVGDVIQLQLATTASATKTYEVRLIAIKVAD